MAKYQGLFIAFEGPDGSGKSTLARGLSEYLINNKQKQVVVTREPGGYNLGICEGIRSIILSNSNQEMTPMTEALLFAASRAQHVSQLIKPCLEAGQVVICDRYVYSSLAYQGVARGLGIKKVWEINENAIDGLIPDITFFIDIPYEVGLARIANSGREADRLDNESAMMHKKVCEGYQEIKKKHKFEVINGNRPYEEVFADIIKVIDKVLK